MAGSHDSSHKQAKESPQKHGEKTMSKKNVAFAKAQASHCEFGIAAHEAHQAQIAFTKAVAKAEKLKKRADLDLQTANALE